VYFLSAATTFEKREEVVAIDMLILINSMK